MKTLKILRHPHPSLSTPCVDVPEGTNIRALAHSMFKVMREYGGIGLAANQVGATERLIVVSVGGFKQAIINPVITLARGGQATLKEGCLSFPGVEVSKARYRQITVEGFGLDWEPVKFKLKARAARCIQHEIDHLDGVTIL